MGAAPINRGLKSQTRYPICLLALSNHIRFINSNSRTKQMGYDMLGDTGKDWSCGQLAWRDYLVLATAFGWAPDGAFFKCDEAGFGEHPSGSYLGNDWQQVTKDDACGMAAALNLAVATINAGSPMTDNQVTALKKFEEIDEEPAFKSLTPI